MNPHAAKKETVNDLQRFLFGPGIGGDSRVHEIFPQSANGPARSEKRP
jgi:hypothetical protein